MFRPSLAYINILKTSDISKYLRIIVDDETADNDLENLQNPVYYLRRTMDNITFRKHSKHSKHIQQWDCL